MTRRMLAACIGCVIAISPAARGDDATPSRITAQEFTQLRSDLHPKHQPWADLPWRVSLTEARAAAAREKKPVFLVVNTGCAIGFV